MPQKQYTQTQPEKKNGQKPEHTTLLERTSVLTEISELPGGLLSANGIVESQASHLGDSRLPTIQRQAMVKQIGQVQGNHHLQRVFAPRKSIENAESNLWNSNNEIKTTHIDAIQDEVIGGESIQVATSTELADRGFAGVLAPTGHTVIQRQPKPSLQPGWKKKDVSANSPNFDQKKVGHVNRIPVEMLDVGNQQSDRPDPDELKELKKESGYLGKETSESAKGRAIVLIPESIYPIDPKKPIEVLLHLHGWGVGYRLQKGQKAARDEAIDKTEAQLESSGRSMIAVLPQGTRRSGFGKDFNSNTYLEKVFEKLRQTGHLPKDATVGQVVLTAHSGGGATVRKMLEHPSRLPHNMAELVLFDAINGSGQLRAVKDGLKQKLDNDFLKLTNDFKGRERDYLTTSMRFRGYYTTEGKKYPKLYGKLKEALDDWFAAHEAELGGQGSLAYEGLRQNYQVRPVNGIKHDQMMGSGSIGGGKAGLFEEALSALDKVP